MVLDLVVLVSLGRRQISVESGRFTLTGCPVVIAQEASYPAMMYRYDCGHKLVNKMATQFQMNDKRLKENECIILMIPSIIGINTWANIKHETGRLKLIYYFYTSLNRFSIYCLI